MACAQISQKAQRSYFTATQKIYLGNILKIPGKKHHALTMQQHQPSQELF